MSANANDGSRQILNNAQRQNLLIYGGDLLCGFIQLLLLLLLLILVL
jgi:hypothetical protein